MIIYYAIPCIVIWSISLIAFYPGVRNPDFDFQWQQVHTLNFVDWHPVAHTLVYWLLSKIWDSVAIASIFQILFLAVVFGYGLYIFEKMGFKKKWLYFISVVLAIMPQNFMMSVNLWKDIPYSASLLGLSFCIINLLVLERKNQIISKSDTVIFILFCSFVFLFRQNGIVVPILISLALLLVFYRNKKMCIKIAQVFLISISLFLLVKLPLYHLLQVNRVESFGITPFIHQIAAVAANKGNISEEDKTKVNKIIPLEFLKNNYSPFIIDPLLFSQYKKDSNFCGDIYSHRPIDKKELLNVWYDVVINNPKIILSHELILTSLIWRINQIPNGGEVFTVGFNENVKIGNISRIIPYNLLLNLKICVTNIICKTYQNIWLQIFWRPATFLYLIIVLSSMLILKNGFKWALVSLPVIFNILGLLPTLPAQHFRYVYSVILLFPFVLMLSFIKIKNKEATT